MHTAWIALTFLTNSLFISFLTASLSTISLIFLKSTGLVSNLPISNLSVSGFKLAKPTFLANSDVSIPAAFFESAFVAQLYKPNPTFTFFLEVLV